MKQYTGKERVMAACKGECADRVPINVRFPRAHELVGFTAEECLLDPDKALQAEIKAYERFPSDIVGVPGDPYLPTVAAVTYEASYGQGARPKPYLEDKAKLEELKSRGARLPRRYAKYQEMVPETISAFPDAWVGAHLVAPWTIAVTLRGAEGLIMDTIDDPEWVHNLMLYTSELSKMRGDALIDAGATLFLSETSGSCSLISPSIYKEFVHPYLQGVIAHFREKKALLDLHICGYTDPILEYTTTMDVDILDIDAPTSLEKMVEISQKRMAIKGNLSAELFRDGTKAEIEKAVKNCIDIAAQGGAYILSPGCSIPEDTPWENIRYFWEAGLNYGRYN